MFSPMLLVCVRRAVAFIGVVLMLAPCAWAKKSPDASSDAIAWARTNKAKFNQVVQDAQSKTKPAVPVPPQVMPPCHVCGDTTQTQGEQQVAAWVAQSEEPENSEIGTFATLSHQLAVMRQGSSSLSAAAQSALNGYPSDDENLQTIAALTNRLLAGKALPMAQAYDKDDTRYYAGVSFLLGAAHIAGLTGGSSDQLEQQALDDADTWVETVVNKIQQDVFDGHKYNLCPVYGTLVRSSALLGGAPANWSQAEMEKYEQVLTKLQNFLTFNVSFKLDVKTPQADGSHMNASWTGKAKMNLKVDLGNSCYTPQWDNDGTMPISVTNWDMVVMEQQPNGTKIPNTVTLTSPHSYNAKLAAPLLNLCDPQAVLQLPLAGMTYPQETILAKGQTVKGSFLGGFIGAVSTLNEIKNGAANAVTGGVHSATNSNANSDNSNSQAQTEAQMKALMAQHAGDPSWFMSAAGQAAIAKLQQQAVSLTQQSIAKAGIVSPTSNITTMSQLNQSLGSVHLTWTNGNTSPASQTMHVVKDTNDITLTVNVDWVAQQ